MEVVRVEPEGRPVAVAWRRLAASPGLWLPLSLCAAAVGFQTAHWLRDDTGPAGAAACSLWAAITALLVRAYHGPRFAGVPAAPDDDPHPLPVRWLDAPPGCGRPGSQRHVHVLGSLRIVGGSASRSDALGVAVLAALGFPAMGWLGPLGVVAVAWAFGFPRGARISVDIPWSSVAAVHHEGRHRFRVRRSDGGADVVLEARFSSADLLADRLAQRIGGRLDPAGAALPPEVVPSVLRPAEGDEDAGVAELILRRARGRWAVALALGCIGLAAVLLAVAHLLGSLPLRIGAAALGLVGAFAALVTAGNRRALWRGPVPAPGDAPDPLPVRWTNRPGWPGPGPQQVHVRAEGLRLVAFEWEAWDVLVTAAASLAAIPVLGFWAPMVVLTLLGALGIPRRRRYAVDLAWTDVVRAEIRGTAFEIRSSLAAPADVVRVEAKYSARERLRGTLVERLGDRVALEPPAR